MCVRVNGWTAAQIRDCIRRCEAEVAQMVARRDKPDAIESRRRGIHNLYVMLDDAERLENSSKDT